MGVSSRQRANSPSLCLLVLFRPSRDWMTYLSSAYRVKWGSISRNSLTDAPRNNLLPATWASLSPVKLIHNPNHQSADVFGMMAVAQEASLPELGSPCVSISYRLSRVLGETQPCNEMTGMVLLGQNEA